MSVTESVNLDTSVLVNYLYSSLPEPVETDKGSQKLVDGDSFDPVIGGKAEDEFCALCERRYTLYDDVVSFFLETDDPLFDYDPRERSIDVSENDRSHIRKNIPIAWHDLERREQLSLLRRCMQDIELYRMNLVGQLVEEAYPKQENPSLLQDLRSELDIGHDCEILVDAIEMSRSDAIETLASLDGDLTDEQTAEVVSEVLDEVFDSDVTLDIKHASELSE